MMALYDAGGRFICVVADDSLLAELQRQDDARAAGVDLYDVAIAQASGQRAINRHSLARADRRRELGR